jgi:hypothetical protein
VPLPRAHQLLDGGRRRDGVVVEEPHQVGVVHQRTLDADREAARAAGVLAEADDVQPEVVGVRRREQLGGAVVRGVVDHDDRRRRVRLPAHRRERLLEELAPVPRHHDGDDTR